MFYVQWKEKRLELTHSAYRELTELGLDMLEIVYVLDNGFNCSESKRKKGTIEKCIVKGKKLLRVVIKEWDYDYPNGELEDVLRIIHIGKENLTQQKFEKK